MPARTAKADWHGSIREGKGRVSFAGFDQPYTWKSRFAEETGSNPEEMLGAAIAGCFSMALSEDLGDAGHVPESVHTAAHVTIDPKDGGGWSITGIVLDTEVRVAGIDEAAFQRVADGTRRNCPVARALAAPVTLNARMV